MTKTKRKKVALLGATGSIGSSTLQIIAQHPNHFELVAVSAHQNVAALSDIVDTFHPKHACITSSKQNLELAVPHMHYGAHGLVELAELPDVDIVLVAVVGFAAMRPVIAAAKAGKRIACANKEAIVCAGELIMPMLSQNQLIPVDSEHSAIFQCLQGESEQSLSRIWLTCSGGPFLHMSKNELKKVTATQALRHPNWLMGDKITIDSATLMNKGLEVIEAHHLFSASYERISVLIHPESIVHSMAGFVDGSIKAQLGIPKMTVPIEYALTFPERLNNSVGEVDFYDVSCLHFEHPNMENFRCLQLALDAGKEGGTAPCIMNAANEVANAAFRLGKLDFFGVSNVIDATLARFSSEPVSSVQQLEEVDRAARDVANSIVEEYV